MQDTPSFVHLRVHSKYSILESTIDPAALPEACSKLGMPAVAIADSNNMFASLEFAATAAAAGIQPINGCQFSLNPAAEDSDDPQDAAYPTIVLLAKDQTGYGNLVKLNSCLYLDNRKKTPHLVLEDLRRFNQGLICLTGGQDGPVAAELLGGQPLKATELASELASIFERRLYVEIQRHRQVGSSCCASQEKTEDGLLSIAYDLDLPLVATNDVHFLKPKNFEPVDILFYIKNGGYISQNDPRRKLTREHYFKSQQEMADLFEDLPDAVANTVEIARRCAYHTEPRDPILPVYCADEGMELRRQAVAGLDMRLKSMEGSEAHARYRKRLEEELEVISGAGFAGYFLIVSDFLEWARKQNIPVGPGRGSGAGSLVAYSLQITNIDPLRFGLLFERFLNVERASVPDFDIDFCQLRRGEVVDYVRQRYGNDRVTNIITFGNLKSKAAIRDIGRIMRIPRGTLNTLSGAIGFDVRFSQARAENETLISAERSDRQIAQMFDYIEEIDGIPRNVSTHAAGIVIGDRPLDELVPLYSEQNSSESLTQFNKKWVEKAGLVKMDFLGLKTLTIISRTLDLVRRRGTDIDIDAIPLDDGKTFELYASGNTAGIFQCDGVGMTSTLRSMKPTRLDDIIAIIALYRPGPMDQIPKYLDVKHGRSKRDMLHPLIDDVLTETHGIVVYQEQVMQIAQLLAGYSMGRADILRRAMGQKNRDIMAREKPHFLSGAAGKGVSSSVAGKIWEFLSKFAEYGFNKSHAAGYAIVSYQTAWLKAHHLLEFMASVMSMDMNHSSKLAVAKRELESMGVNLEAPCINASDATFAVRDGRIHYALASIKNVGVGAAEHIVSARGQEPFKDIYDFARRIDPSHVTKSALESLARAGAFDTLGLNRCTAFSNVDTLMGFSRAHREQKASGQMSLFGDSDNVVAAPQLTTQTEWSVSEKCRNEIVAIGHYLTTHPLGLSIDELREQGLMPISEVAKLIRDGRKAIDDVSDIKVAGHLDSVRRRGTKTGETMAWIKLSDPSGDLSAAVFLDELRKSGRLLKKGALVTMFLNFPKRRGNNSLRANASLIKPLRKRPGPQWTALKIHFNKPEAPREVKEILTSSSARLARHHAKTVSFCPCAADLDVEVEFVLPEQYLVNNRVVQAIKMIEGVTSINRQ